MSNSMTGKECSLELDFYVSAFCSTPKPTRCDEMKMIKKLVDQSKFALLKAVVLKVGSVSVTHDRSTLFQKLIAKFRVGHTRRKDNAVPTMNKGTIAKEVAAAAVRPNPFSANLASHHPTLLHHLAVAANIESESLQELAVYTVKFAQPPTSIKLTQKISSAPLSFSFTLNDSFPTPTSPSLISTNIKVPSSSVVPSSMYLQIAARSNSQVRIDPSHQDLHPQVSKSSKLMLQEGPPTFLPFEEDQTPSRAQKRSEHEVFSGGVQPSLSSSTNIPVQNKSVICDQKEQTQTLEQGMEPKITLMESTWEKQTKIKINRVEEVQVDKDETLLCGLDLNRTFEVAEDMFTEKANISNSNMQSVDSQNNIKLVCAEDAPEGQVPNCYNTNYLVRIQDRDSDGNLISNDLADYALVECKICHIHTPMTRLRSHTRSAHNTTITEYKAQFGPDLVPIEIVHHRCGLCGELVLLDSDHIATHLKTPGHYITHKNYNNGYMVDARSNKYNMTKRVRDKPSEIHFPPQTQSNNIPVSNIPCSVSGKSYCKKMSLNSHMRLKHVVIASNSHKKVGRGRKVKERWIVRKKSPVSCHENFGNLLRKTIKMLQSRRASPCLEKLM
eukprot:GFUD01018748.1.p1 GENE.GFUD01018748.1~~GFUD01018748.1.p1  ORF type:complete len:612 (+),score=120.78 GFUD01018748.1:50-1885(+)